MSNTVDLVKSAQKREYINFEDRALEALKLKLQENPVMREKLAKLNVAQGIAEAFGKDEDEKDDDKKSSDDEGEKEEKDGDEDEGEKEKDEDDE